MVTNDVYLIKMISGREKLEQSIREKFDDDESIFATLDAALSYIMAFDYYVTENPNYYHEKTYIEQRFESGTWIIRKNRLLGIRKSAARIV